MEGREEAGFSLPEVTDQVVGEVHRMDDPIFTKD